MTDFKRYGGIRMTINENQTIISTSELDVPFVVDDFSIEILQRKLHHVYFLAMYKLLFAVCALVTAIKFYRSVSSDLVNRM